MGSKYSRKNINGLQVPRLTFKNDKGHKVVIQGMIHIGDKGFYERLLKTFESFDGEIHLEGVSNKNNHSLGDVLKHLHVLMANMTDLSMQKDYISKKLIVTNSTKFKNHDLDFEDVSDELAKMLEDIDDVIYDSSEVEAVFTNRLIMSLFSSPLLWNIRTKKDLDILDKKVLLDKRNDYALSKVLDNDNNVMLVWGIAHIPGMSQSLIEKDYNLKNIEWDTIFPWFNKNKTPSAIRKMTIKRELKNLVEILDNMDD